MELVFDLCYSRYSTTVLNLMLRLTLLRTVVYTCTTCHNISKFFTFSTKRTDIIRMILRIDSDYFPEHCIYCAVGIKFSIFKNNFMPQTYSSSLMDIS